MFKVGDRVLFRCDDLRELGTVRQIKDRLWIESDDTDGMWVLADMDEVRALPLPQC